MYFDAIAYFAGMQGDSEDAWPVWSGEMADPLLWSTQYVDPNYVHPAGYLDSYAHMQDQISPSSTRRLMARWRLHWFIQLGWPERPWSVAGPSMDPSVSDTCRVPVVGTTAIDVPDTPNSALTGHARQDRNSRGWRHVVLHFTPSWFSVNMGTGIVSILLHNLPYNTTGVYWVSVGIFTLNVALFLTFSVISILRYALFRGVWGCMVRHPVQSLFLGMWNAPGLEVVSGSSGVQVHSLWA